MRLSKILTLTEAAVGADLQYSPLSVEEVINLLETHCSDAQWMVDNNNPIWRGLKYLATDVPGYYIDPSKTVRKSQNTTNYYTIIWDHHPDWKGWPKRSRSLIATSNLDYAGWYGNAFAAIPYNGVQIGVVNVGDLHDVKVNLGPWTSTYPQINRELDRLDIPHTSYEALMRYTNSLDFYIGAGNSDDTRGIIVNLINGAPTPMEGLFDLFSMERMDPKPTLHTTKTLQSAPGWDETEVWIGGPCLLISHEMWTQLQGMK